MRNRLVNQTFGKIFLSVNQHSGSMLDSDLAYIWYNCDIEQRYRCRSTTDNGPRAFVVQFVRAHHSLLDCLVYRHMHSAQAATVSTHFGAIFVTQRAHVFLLWKRINDRLRTTRNNRPCRSIVLSLPHKHWGIFQPLKDFITSAKEVYMFSAVLVS